MRSDGGCHAQTDGGLSMDKKTKMFGDLLMSQWGAPMPRKGSPITPEQQAKQWLQNLNEDTKYFDEDEMRRAFSLLRRGHEKSFMPMTPEIMKALNQARKEIDLEKPKLKVGITPPVSRDEDRTRMALNLLRGTAMADEASEKGWIGPLFDFVRKQGSLPRGAEVEAVKEEARETLRWIKRQQENNTKIFDEKPSNRFAHPSWQPLGDPHQSAEFGMRTCETLQKRTDRLCDFFLHGVESEDYGLRLSTEKSHG